MNQPQDSKPSVSVVKATHIRYEGMPQHWLRATNYSVLHILHNRPITSQRINLPGGTEYHVADLIRLIPTAAHWSIYSTGREYCLTAHIPGREREYYISADDLNLSSLVHPDLFDVIHVHHTSKIDYAALAESLLRHGRYFISLHDFRLCCPNINLLTPEGRLCNGHECAAACGRKQSEIDSLRSTTRQVFKNARMVFHFSESTKTWFTNILGGEYPWKLIEHGIQAPKSAKKDDIDKNDLPQPSSLIPLKVAFLGGIGAHKGTKLIQQIVKIRKTPSGIPIQWHMIGPTEENIDCTVIRHGEYERDQLPAIMHSASPHLVAILSICPETYCYTFSEALACGIPVISTPLGAPAERLRQYRCGWILEDLGVDAFLETLQHVVDNWDEYRAVRRRIPDIPLKTAQEIAAIYEEIYLAARPNERRTAPERLLQIVSQFRTSPYQRFSWPRWMIGRFMNACITAVDAINARSLVKRVVKRVLPDSVRNRINELRQSAS